jgi:Tol biopolymer transport system component
MLRTIRASMAIAAVAVAMHTAAHVSAQERRPITEEDLLRFVWVADPQMAPGGTQIAFVRVGVDREKDQYESSIWIVPSEGGEPARQLTAGPRDSAPRWSPDGTRLAFVRAPEKDGRVQPAQLYTMAMVGGEPRPITEMPRGAANPVWSPDRKTIAFTSATRPDEMAAKDTAAGSDAPKTAKRESDVRVITEAVYRANGVAGFGYVERDRPAHVWTVAVPDDAEPATPKRITSGEFAAGNHRWSPDGTEIYFTSDRRQESYYHADDSDLYAVTAGGGEPRRIVSIDGSIGLFTVSPDGRRIAFIGAQNGKPERSYDQPDLWVVDLPGGTPRNLTASYDFDIGGAISGDQRAPRGQHPAAPAASLSRVTLRWPYSM